MIFKVQEQTFVTYSPKIQYYIKAGSDNYLLKDGTIAMNASNGWWHTRKEAEIFLAGWRALYLPPTPKLNQVDFEPEYKLGTRHIQYIDGIRTIHRYCKLDFGITARVGSAYSKPKDISYVQYRWFCMRG